MSLVGKLEKEIELKSSAEKFYHIWKKQSNHVPTASPKNIQAVEVHEGDWDKHGAVKQWNYTVEGRNEVYKEKVEHDDANMSVTLVGVDGDIFKDFKTWKAIFKAIPKGRGNTKDVARVTLEYEKRNANVPEPVAYIDFVASIAEDIDAHITKAFSVFFRRSILYKHNK